MIFINHLYILTVVKIKIINLIYNYLLLNLLVNIRLITFLFV